ncbi:MAG: hypothetical protein P4N59_05110 [Negativicutes bacterium]|nr:hypothetical protein [Negativicutes bacterium]
MFAIGDFDAPVAGGDFDPRTAVKSNFQAFDIGFAGEGAAVRHGIGLCAGCWPDSSAGV